MIIILILLLHSASMPNNGMKIHIDHPQETSWCAGPIHSFPPNIPSPRGQAAAPAQPFVPYKILYLIDPKTSSPNKEILVKAGQYANDKLSKFLQAPTVDDVRFPRSCVDKPTNSCNVPCDSTQVWLPEEYYGPCSCDPNPPSNISNSVNQQNKENYTLVIWVTIVGDGTKPPNPMQCQQQTLASAGVCGTSQVDERPTHGNIIFCRHPKNQVEHELFGVFLHETFHTILPTLVGATDPSICPRGTNPWEPIDARIARCNNTLYDEVQYNWIDQFGTPSPRKKFIAKLPLIREAAASHFGCENVTGAELHIMKVGNTTSLNTGHWSQRLFPDELMSPIQQTDLRLSNLTLSVLKLHKTWYKVDKRYVPESLEQSKPPPDLACDIPNKPCFEILNARKTSPGVKSVVPYCYQDKDLENGVAVSLCTRDQKTRLSCKLYEDCPILTPHLTNYFYDHPNCMEATKMSDDPSQASWIVGGTIGPGSICITFTYHPAVFMANGTRLFAVCVVHQCRLADRTVQLKFRPQNIDRSSEECFVECHYSQSNRIVNFTKSATCTAGFSTPYSVICPDYTQLCGSTNITDGLSTIQQTSTDNLSTFPKTSTDGLTSVSNGMKRAAHGIMIGFAVILVIPYFMLQSCSTPVATIQ